MKKFLRFTFVLSVSLLLSSCFEAKNQGSSSSVPSSSTIVPTSSEEPSISPSPASSEEPSSPVSESSSSESSESLPSSTSSSSVVPSERTVTFYAMNDFHGAVKQNMSNDEPGILSLGSFLKEKGTQENTLLINSGDMFQGAIESNYNRGKLLTDCLNSIEFDSFALGNHEFDWGQEAIRQNKLRSAESDGYQTPWLCANVYDYDQERQRDGTTQQSDLGGLYSIRTLENGLKIGIIGAIGLGQWTSICSSYVDDIVFKDPIPIIKSLSDELRGSHNCDLVVLSFHADQEEALGTGLTDISPVSNEKYVDAVFCAHSHQLEDSLENGVVFTQNHAYGRDISKLTLTLDSNNDVTDSDLETFTSDEIVRLVGNDYDSELKSLVDSYGEESQQAANEILGTLSGGTMSRYSNLPNMLATAMLEAAQKEGYSPALAMVNSARKNLYYGDITYGEIYECFPFDNEVYMIECDGADILNEASYDSNVIARAEENAIEAGKTYQIAVIDYLAVHKSTKRVYDYFPSMKVTAKVGEKEGHHYRDILADYIRGKKTIYSSDYSSNLWKYDCDQLSQTKS